MCVCVALPITLYRFPLALEVLIFFAKKWGMVGMVDSWKELGEGNEIWGR